MKSAFYIFLGIIVFTAVAAVSYSLTRDESISSGPLQIGVEMDFPPFSYVDQNQKLAGFDIEISHALCKKLRTPCKITPMEYEKLHQALDDKKIRLIIAGFGINTDKRSDYAFSQPYYRSRPIFISNDHDFVKFDLTDKSQIKKMTVGVQSGSVQEEIMTQDFVPQGAALKTYKTNGEMVKALKNHEVNVIFTESLSGYALLNGDDGKDLYVGARYATPDSSLTEGRIVALPGDDKLIEKINTAIVQIQGSGEYQEISLKYFPFMNY